MGRSCKQARIRLFCRELSADKESVSSPSATCLTIVAHVCGDPLSCYTCRATCVAADFLNFLMYNSGVCMAVVSCYPPPPRRPCRTRRASGARGVARQAASHKGVALQRALAATFCECRATLCNYVSHLSSLFLPQQLKVR